MTGHVLVTVRGGAVRWVRAGDRFRPVPWAKDVEAADDPAGVRLRRLGPGRGAGGENLLAPGRVVGLDGNATACLAAEASADGDVPAVRLGPTLRSRSEPMIRAFHMAALAATVSDPVLIVGESGTGKELIAQAIHDLRAVGSASRSRSAPFLALNMGAIPEDLAEAQMFGWVRGAFTGAVESRAGAFEAAGDGTLFLDEVGEASLGIQAKILRVVEARTVCRVGSVTPVPVRARLLTATHRDLATDVASGRFRLDLYERLACVVVRVPPLRERREDIPLLVDHFLKRHGTELNRPGKSVSAELMEMFLRYPWEGNVRELENVIMRGILFSPDRDIRPEDVGFRGDGPKAAPPQDTALQDLPYKEAKERVLRRFTVSYVERLLTLTQGNVSQAARICGLERQALQQIMRRFGIQADGFRSTGHA